MMSAGTVRHEQGLSSTEPIAKEASARSRPGILIFSRRRQLLHMNSQALELTGHHNQAEIKSVHDIRSAPVRELTAQIQETLANRKDANIWGIFELKRIIVETERKILVRGVEPADQKNSSDNSHIVIMLEEVGRRQEQQAQQAPVFSSNNRCTTPWQAAEKLG